MEAKLMTVVRKNIILVSIAAMALLLFMPGLSEARLSAEDARAVWSKVAKATELTELPFSIKQETVPNAWVTNGSSVTVTTGLLELLDTQSELYGVLSHEAGHAKLNHYENTVKGESAFLSQLHCLESFWRRYCRDSSRNRSKPCLCRMEQGTGS